MSLWTEQEIADLRKIYPTSYVEEVPKLFPNRTLASVRIKAKELGITKTGARVAYFRRHYPSGADGGYVSGLFDGEGHFKAGLQTGGRAVRIGIQMNLRHDDIELLWWLRSYFDAGSIYELKAYGKRSPTCQFYIGDLYELDSKVVPHFETYPLRGKKKQDYELWMKLLKVVRESPGKPYSLAKADYVRNLINGLQQQRRYKPHIGSSAAKSAKNS